MGIVKYSDPLISRDKVVNRRKFSQIHCHDEYELYYLLNGETKYFIGNEIFHLSKGNFIFVPKGMFHKTDSEECMNVERILLSMDDSIYDQTTKPVIDELSRCKLIYIPDNLLYKAEEVLYKLENEYNKNTEYKDILTRLYILELLTIICRLKCDYNPKIKPSDYIVHTVSEYITANYGSDITLSRLSKIFCVSESHLSRKFKEVSGLGVNEYTTYIRIMNAQHMLKSKKYSVTEVAAKCGYNDSNYFAAVFKKLKGVTPHKYSKSEE